MLAMLALAAPARAEDERGVKIARCQLVVAGRTMFNGPCYYNKLDAEGSFIITETARRPYFAYLVMLENGLANASWNADRASTHAHAQLGDMRRRGACWSNTRNKVCAWR